MRICIWLTTDPNKAKMDDPIAIRRWASHPCVPRIGETYAWIDQFDAEDLCSEFGMEEVDDDLFRVTDVRHVFLPRSLGSFLRGRPKNFPIVVCTVPDPKMLDWLLKKDQSWTVKAWKWEN